MDLAELKLFYIRKLSTNLRFWTDIEDPNGLEESPVVDSFTGLGRAVLVIFCRNKQRLLMQAWQKWQDVVAWEDVEKTGQPIHDYEYDLRCILSRATGKLYDSYLFISIMSTNIHLTLSFTFVYLRTCVHIWSSSNQ